MSKSIKFKNATYLDSSSITHKKRTLKAILDWRYNTFTNSKGTIIKIGNGYTILPFDTSDNPNSKLIIQSNGTIKIGSGISRIRISGSCSLSVVNDYDLRRLSVFKNDTIVNRTQMYYNHYHSFTLNPKCISVKENDVISLKFTGEKVNSTEIPMTTEITHLTIEIIA